MLLNMIEKENPDYLAFTFDYYKSFRHDIYKEYKAQRKPTPPELVEQMPKVYKMVEKMWIPIFAKEWREADDIMWTIANLNSKNDDLLTFLVTWDMDILQLVEDDKTIVAIPEKWYKFPKYFDEKAIIEKYDLKNSQIIDFKILAWDSSDNIKWVEWIWKVWATKLLEKYKTVENIYKNLSEITWATWAKLKNSEDKIKQLRKIITIEQKIELPEFSLEKCIFKNIHSDVLELFRKYEFHSLQRRLDKIQSDKSLSESQISLF